MPSHAPLVEWPRPYDWLLFDADGTLFDYETAERAALTSALGQIRVEFKPELLESYRRINAQLWQDLEKNLLRPDVLKVRRFEMLFASAGITCSAHDFAELYVRCLADCATLVDGARETVNVLKSLYGIVVVTNGLQAVQRRRILQSPLRDCVSEIIISEEIGAAKPATEFFDIALSRIGHPPRQRVLMIGDSWSSDMVGAAGYGLDTCWYNPQGKVRPGHPSITREIRSLFELREWLCIQADTCKPTAS